MVAQTACPNPDTIRDLLNGDVPEDSHPELAVHFDDCGACRDRFDAEALAPDFLQDAARSSSHDRWLQGTAAFERLIRDLPQQLSHAADTASMESWTSDSVADFLEPSDNPEHIGRLGSYDIIEVIGRGGMGIVLRGVDSKLNRVVAIKVLAPEWATNPNARRRFFREGQAAAAVSHDHVVTIHAVDDGERLPYLVMEYIAGESLEDYIRREGALSLEQILRIGRQSALGLAAAHEVGLVHRDMKPANILLENGIQRVHITDFGLARAVDDVAITQSGVVPGTPLYMAPEQAAGESLDQRTDLFSLGSVLYTMCTGRPAFRAATTMAVLRRVCDDSPRPINEINPDIPDWLIDIINRLIAKNPDERFQTANEVAELLGQHLAHVQDPARNKSPLPSAKTQSSGAGRKTGRWALLLVLLAVVVTLGITEASGVTGVVKHLGVILKLRTPEGTLVVDIIDPNVKVRVEGSEVVVSGIGVHELRLAPGKHQWTAERNGKPAQKDWVEISQDGKTKLKIRTEPNVTAAANPDKPAPDENPTEPVAKSERVVISIPDPRMMVQIDGMEVAKGKGTHQVRVSLGRHKWIANIGGETIAAGEIDVKAGSMIAIGISPAAVVPAVPNPEANSDGTHGLLNTEASHAAEQNDGLVFWSPQRIRRLTGDSVLSFHWGKHRFDKVPGQLWGQRWTGGSVRGGQLKFSYEMTADQKKQRAVESQRLWLLVPHVGWEGGMAPDGKPLDTSKSLMERGWKPGKQLTSSPVVPGRDGKDETVTWSTFYHDANRRHTRTIRTHFTFQPILVWGSVDLGGIEINPRWDQRVGVFKPGATLPMGNGGHEFHKIPDQLTGRLFTRRNGYQGNAKFRVVRDQEVIVGMYDWSQIDKGGNPSGNWQPELTSEQAMLNQGWKKLAVIPAAHTIQDVPESPWTFYSRNCRAGEAFLLRNHKYQAPIILSEDVYKDARLTDEWPDVPAQAAFTPLPPLGKFPEAEDAINYNLMASLVLGPRQGVSRPQVFAMDHWLRVENEMPGSFIGVVEGSSRSGSKYIFGQIADAVTNTENYIFRRCERVGNRIRVEFRRSERFINSGGPDLKAKPPKRQPLYFAAKLPLLPTGTYEVEAVVRSYSINKDGVDGPDGRQSPISRGRIVVDNTTGTELSRLATQAIVLKPRTQQPPSHSQTPQQQPTGLDLKTLLNSTDQIRTAVKLAKQSLARSGLQEAIENRHHWTLCAALDSVGVEPKTLAARELAKLKIPDSVPVLLIAAKQNAYELIGTKENMAKHTNYRIELRNALEAATGLKLIPDVRTIIKRISNEDIPIRSDGNPILLTAQVDFARVEKWLRQTYLPPTNEQAKDNQPADVQTKPGLIGRAKLNRTSDSGYTFHYEHGFYFTGEEHIPVGFREAKNFAVTLEGYVDVPRHMIVDVWHGGGGVSHDVNWLYIDGKELGSVGDDRSKHGRYKVPLLEGRHKVRWVLTGGTFRTNLLAIVDPDSGELLPLIGAESPADKATPKEQRVHIKGTKLGWPLTKVDWLPAVVRKLHVSD